MSQGKPKFKPGARMEAYRKLIDAIKAGDMETATSLEAEDVEINEVASLPWGGTRRGRQGGLEIGANLASQFETSETTIEHMAEFDDDGLFVLARMRGVAKKTLSPIDEYYFEVLWYNEDLQFYKQRIAFGDDVRLLRALGYTTFPDQRVPVPYPYHGSGE